MQSTSPRFRSLQFFICEIFGIRNDLLKFKKLRMEIPQLTHARGESPTVAVRYGSSVLTCVAGVKRGRGNLGARGKKERNACRETIVLFKPPPNLICKDKLTVKCLVIKWHPIKNIRGKFWARSVFSCFMY